MALRVSRSSSGAALRSAADTASSSCPAVRVAEQGGPPEELLHERRRDALGRARTSSRPGRSRGRIRTRSPRRRRASRPPRRGAPRECARAAAGPRLARRRSPPAARAERGVRRPLALVGARRSIPPGDHGESGEAPSCTPIRSPHPSGRLPSTDRSGPARIEPHAFRWSAPEDGRGIAVDLVQQLADVPAERQVRVLVPAFVAITPVQAPDPSRPEVPNACDRETCPFGTHVRTPRRAALDDRHVASRGLALDAHLTQRVRRHPPAAPPLDLRKSEFRNRFRHAGDPAPRTSTDQRSRERLRRLARALMRVVAILIGSPAQHRALRRRRGPPARATSGPQPRGMPASRSSAPPMITRCTSLVPS
jgi:hypothetical protein